LKRSIFKTRIITIFNALPEALAIFFLPLRAPRSRQQFRIGARQECCRFVAALLSILLPINCLTIKVVADVADFPDLLSHIMAFCHSPFDENWSSLFLNRMLNVVSEP
jgi:hypothetical protein